MSDASKSTSSHKWSSQSLLITRGMYVTSSSGFHCCRPHLPLPPQILSHTRSLASLHPTLLYSNLFLLIESFDVSLVLTSPLHRGHGPIAHLTTILPLLLFLHSAVGYITRFTLSVCSPSMTPLCAFYSVALCLITRVHIRGDYKTYKQISEKRQV